MKTHTYFPQQRRVRRPFKRCAQEGEEESLLFRTLFEANLTL